MRAWHLGAVICSAKTCYLDAIYYGADPQGLFLQKVIKGHICEILSRKGLNCKNYSRSPRSRAARAGRPAAGRPAPRDLRANIFVKVFAQKPLPPRSGATRSRPPGSGAAGVYFCKFWKRKYIFIKNKNIKYKNKKPRTLPMSAPRPAHNRQWIGPSCGRRSGSPWVVVEMQLIIFSFSIHK